MGAKGKIGLILPEINSALDHAFLEGACDQGISLGYDVIVYTGIFNSLREVRCRRKRKTQKNDTQNAKNSKKIGE